VWGQVWYSSGMSNSLTQLTAGQLQALDQIRAGQKPNHQAVKALVAKGVVRVEIVGNVDRPGWYRRYHIIALDEE